MNSNNIQNNNSSEDENNNNNYINHISIAQEEIKYNNLKEKETLSNKEEEFIDNNNKYIDNENDKNDEENEDNTKNPKNNNNINNNNNNVTISNLLFQLKQMSDKQLYLLDIISNLQKNSSEQINNLNRRINELEGKINKNNDDYFQNYNEIQDINYNSREDNPNNILTKILNGKNNEKLINYLNALKLEEIKKLDIKLIEDTLIKLCILLTEGFKVHEIISFIKGILIINKIKLKDITKKNLKDVFNFVQQNLSNLKDEDSIDISLIISYLNI